MLPPRIKGLLKTNAHAANQRCTATQRAGITHANALMRYVAVKQTDELGPAEAAAVDKALRLP